MDDQLPRVLITGAGGFVGRALVAALAERARIVPAMVAGRRADLLDPAARAGLIAGARAEVLIHLAWVTEHGKFWSSPANAAWQAASVDLFARFYAVGGRRIIGIGSCAEYDWSTGAARLAEDAALTPHTAYGAAKLRAAEALDRLATRSGASWAWGRVFFSFGPGEPPGRLIPLILRAVRDRAPLGIGPGDTVRDFCAMRHVADALADLSLSAVEGPVNLGSGHAVRFDDLARLANGLGDGQPVIQPDSRPLSPGEPRILVADTTRLRTEVGYHPPDRLAADLADHFATHFRASD